MTIESQQPDPFDWLEEQRARPGGSRLEFQDQLQACDRLLVTTGRRIADAIVPVTTAFLEADTHAAARQKAATSDIERHCTDLEEACYILIARQSPVGGDLRRVVAALRSTGDLRRSSDLLAHVATSLTWVHPPSMPEELRQLIAQLGTVSAELFSAALDAWDTHDGLAANELEQRDDQVDLLQKCLLTELYTGRRPVEEAVSLALIARYYERIADHAVEMARQVAYLVTGERVGQGD